MPAFELGGRRIEYHLVRGTSRRYTYFRFRPDLSLEVVLPKGRSGDPRAAIARRARWILEKYDEMQSSNRVLDERRVMFEGRFLDIVYEEVLDREELVHDAARGTVLVRVSDRSRVTELVRRWFLRETSRYVMGRLADLSPSLKTRYRMADVREIRSWGYCTRSGRLSFSWQLIALPERLREYIIFHELTHLEHFDHSKAFKRRLAEYCPDFRQRENELDLVSPHDLSYF